jgi:hypothetical protein
MTDVVLRVDSEDEDPVWLERTTTALFGDLRSLGLVNVGRALEEVPAGGKSGVGQSIATLVVSGVLSAGTVTALYKVIAAFLDRTKARSVTWKENGKEIVLTAVSAKDQRAAVELLLAARAEPDHEER